MLPTGMFYGQLLGLVIAALPLESGFSARLPTVFPQWGGLYWIEVRVMGTETAQYDGRTIELLRVDAEWLNLRDGAIYPGGPKESGGSYYIVSNPRPGIPRVWRYMNNGVDIVPAET